MTEYELYHFGIPGMKWGVRRYQNPDGSLTAAGRGRYDERTGMYTASNGVRVAQARNKRVAAIRRLSTTAPVQALAKYNIRKTASTAEQRNMQLASLDKERAALREYNSFTKERRKQQSQQNKQSLKEMRRYVRKTSYGRIAFHGLERTGALRMTAAMGYAVAKRTGHPSRGISARQNW